MVATKILLVLAALAAVAMGGVVRRAAEGRRGHEEPAFMEGLDDATKEKFKTIFRDRALDEAAKDAALLKLAESSLKPDKVAQFKKENEEFKKHRAQWKAEYEAKYAKLSPNAKKAADQLKTVWHDEKLTFAQKRAKKEEILKSLTEAERKEVRGLHGHHGRRFQPKFMRDLPKETQDKFKAIWHDKSLNDAAKDAALTKLAESVLTSAQLTEFNAHKARIAEWKKELDARIAKLSPNAKKAADEMHALWTNDQLDWDDKVEKIDEIKSKLSDSERKELEALRPAHHKGKDEPESS